MSKIILIQGILKLKKCFGWMISHVNIPWLNYLGVVEFDSEEVAIQAFAEFCAFQINKETSDLENFNWKKSLPFVIDEEKVLELEMRMSEVNVKF